MPAKEIQHINWAMPTEGHTPMYNMHKFFARKQEDVIREYIRAYTDKSDIVLDPFCGSGVMIGEALRLKRKAIGIDINPVAIFVTRNTIKYVDPEQIKIEFLKIKEDIGEEINNLYLTSCRQCKDTTLPATCFTWKDGKLIDVRYDCPHHGRLISKVNSEDLENYENIKNGENEAFFDKAGNCKYWYPTQKLYYSDGTPFKEKQQYESVVDLFTKRNLIALAKLIDRIEKIEDDDLKESFKFAFSSLTHLASCMTPVRPSRPFSSAWIQHSYWYADNFMESNVWDLFERAILDRQSLVKAKENLPPNFHELKEAKQISYLNRRHKCHYLLAQSALTALEEIPENSIDYIITDPPYGHSVQYAELLYMWGCWLKLMDNFDIIVQGEIIENSKQHKTEKDYEDMLYATFRRAFNVLKPGKYCTITFHNPDLKYRNILFRSVVMAGFEFEKIIYQPPPRPSAKSLRQPFGSLEGDYFFRFKKPVSIITETPGVVDKRRVETLIIDITKRIIAERGEPTNYTFIQNSIDPILYQELRKYGLVMDFQPDSVNKILEKHIGDIFQLVDVVVGKTGQKTLLDKAWWFIDPNQHRLDIPLNKRVDEAIANLLKKQRYVTFTEVLTEIYTRFQNSLTPETHTIMDILKENATQVSEGKWEIAPFVSRLQEKHEEMVYYLAKIGELGGFYVDIAIDEYEKIYDGKRLSSQLKLTQIRPRELDENKKSRIKRIDVIWHNREEIIAEFEVEHSTSIVDAVIRGSNIISPTLSRIMVIPQEREDLVSRRFNEPAMQSIMRNMRWDILTYPMLEEFYLKNKTKKKVNIEEFLSQTRKPQTKEERVGQSTLNIF